MVTNFAYEYTYQDGENQGYLY